MNKSSFDVICQSLARRLIVAPVYHMAKWQGTSENPHALKMKEIQHVHLQYDVPGSVEELRADVKPFLPWADNHFETERVSGEPINPGETYKQWRYPASASQHVEGFEFSHSYAERYWPKHAGQGNGGRVNLDTKRQSPPLKGIRHDYGDFFDLIMLLTFDPTTRQAYLPVWFPEDLTAAVKGERVPCTLGYHFLCRDDKLDVVYPMRSCDFVRHFRDDVYLTARLLFWVIDQCRFVEVERGPAPSVRNVWGSITPGKVIMQISSLHCFSGDHIDVEDQ